MSAGTIARDLVLAHTRALKLPGVARTFEALPVKRAMRIGPTRIGPAKIRFSGAVTHSPRASVWI